MNTEAAICDALETAALAFTDGASPAIDNALSTTFKPRDGVPYVEVAYMPNRNQNLFVGNAAPTRHLGIMQISVMYPIGEGRIPAIELAGAVAAAFPKGRRLTSNGVTVQIYEQPSVAPPMQEPDRVRVPVSIRYQAIY